MMHLLIYIYSDFASAEMRMEFRRVLFAEIRNDVSR